MTGKTNALPFHPRDGEGERGVKSGRNKETKKSVGQYHRLPRGVRGETGKMLGGGMIGTKRTFGDEMTTRYYSRDLLCRPPWATRRIYLPYRLLPDLDHLSASRYQIIYLLIREGIIGLSRQSLEYPPPECIALSRKKK